MKKNNKGRKEKTFGENHTIPVRCISPSDSVIFNYISDSMAWKASLILTNYFFRRSFMTAFFIR